MNSNILKAIICKKIQVKGFAVISVDGKCMTPIICDGDAVIVVKSQHYKIGDIVLVYVSKSLRIHRIVKIIDDMYITKGDHALFVDAIDQHKPEVIGLVSKNITSNLKHIGIPIVSRLISNLSLFVAIMRK